MWLINATTFELKFFHSVAQAPHYAILSHTWEDEEVIFQDMRNLEAARTKHGWRKIQYTCDQARKDHLEYCWVDTCCINKESSAELSEAINSMFGIYGGAAVCYIYLSDIFESFQFDDTIDGNRDAQGLMSQVWSERRRDYYPEIWTSGALGQEREAQVSAFARARWWSRSWTLQELIAPTHAWFFHVSWKPIVRVLSIVTLVSMRTGIDVDVLQHTATHLNTAIAKRLSWATGRESTREEDVAYSLFGLLDVNMPLLYGEGSRAFTRLLEELLRTKPDFSTLAWGQSRPSSLTMWTLNRGYSNALFTSSLRDFEWCHDVTLDVTSGILHRWVSITSAGIEIDLAIATLSELRSKMHLDSMYFDLEEGINCKLADLGCESHGERVCLVLTQPGLDAEMRGIRRSCCAVLGLTLMPKEYFDGAHVLPLSISRGGFGGTSGELLMIRTYEFRARYIYNIPTIEVDSAFRAVITDAFPRDDWNLNRCSMSRTAKVESSGAYDLEHIGGLTLACREANT